MSTLVVSQWICVKRAASGSVGLFVDTEEGRTEAGNETFERISGTKALRKGEVGGE
jgi:hypothetical protein